MNLLGRSTRAFDAHKQMVLEGTEPLMQFASLACLPAQASSWKEKWLERCLK
jgi:hypothetical protein